MKKILLQCLSFLFIAALAIPAGAIVLSPEGANTVTSLYATVKGSDVTYNKISTAFSSETFNSILEGYGLTLSPEAVKSVPATYAKASGDKVVFNNNSTAYDPTGYHAIFTSYGLQLSPEEVSAKLGSIDYAKVVNGKIVFGKASSAYSGAEWATILSAYSLPAAMAAPVADAGPADADKDGVPDALDKCPGTPAGAKIDERGCWVLNADLLFDFDKAVIKQEYYPLLDDVVKVLNDNPTLKIEVQGHACSIGTTAYNQGLSERRAKAVATYLVKKNVDSSRVMAAGFGEEKPAYSNDTEEGRSKNRRVEFMPIW